MFYTIKKIGRGPAHEQMKKKGIKFPVIWERTHPATEETVCQFKDGQTLVMTRTEPFQTGTLEIDKNHPQFPHFHIREQFGGKR